MSETTYSVQNAKSSRAKCKTCKEPILKGEMKLVVSYPQKDDRAFALSSNYHVACFKVPRKLLKSGMTIEDFVNEKLVDESETGDLLLGNRDEIVSKLREAATAKKKPTGGDNDNKDDDGANNNLMARLGAAAKKRLAASEEEEPVAKKAKTSSSSEKEFESMLLKHMKHSKKNVAELKDILRWNKQILGGTKEFVLFKVLDGELHGRLSVCPLCQGDLKFLEKDYDNVHCGGRFDEDIQRRIPCNFSAPRTSDKIPRDHPFYVEEPTEEEKEQVKLRTEEKREGGDGGGGGNNKHAGNPVAQELLKDAEAMKLDVSSNAGKKQAATDFLTLCDGKLDLPTNRNPYVEIGKLVLANMGKSPKEIMEVLIDKFGFDEVKKEKAAALEAQTEGACANPKNASLVLALQECAKYYFQEQNRNAGSSYVRAAAAITNLETEVTEENAMSFSKPKTKLEGIGKSTAQRMLEFCQTGTFAKLEEKRAAHA